MTGRRIPVLLYHAVCTNPPDWLAPWTVDPVTFLVQLDLMLETGCTPLTVSDLVRAVDKGDPLPRRPVIITFDDGFVDFADVAAPALYERRMASTLYVTTGAMAGAPRHPALQLPTTEMLGWWQLSPLEALGVEVGAHSHTHPEMDTLSANEVDDELVRPKRLLEQLLGHTVASFAYPHGYCGPRVQRLAAEAGYESACGVRNAFSSVTDNRHCLARLTVRHDTPAHLFSAWLAGEGAPMAAPSEWRRTQLWRGYRRARVAAGRATSWRRAEMPDETHRPTDRPISQSRWRARHTKPRRWWRPPVRRRLQAPWLGREWVPTLGLIALLVGLLVGLGSWVWTGPVAKPSASSSGKGQPAAQPSAATSAPVGSEGPWSLAFQDEFSGSGLDSSKWSTCYDWDCTNRGNPELEWYQASNISVSGGVAYLTERPEQANDKPYTSGLIQSNGHFTFTYGYAEMRAQLPPGDGLWPAFWLLPTDQSFPPEIDAMEGDGSHPSTILQTVHFGDNRQINRNVDGVDFSTGYHTFGVDWEPDAISWYVDGARTWRVSVSISKPMYVLANLAVFGFAPPIQLRSPASLAIDYVRVWQHPS